MKRISLVSALCTLAFTNVFPANADASIITTGNGYSGVVCDNGTVSGWGDNSEYQLGNGTADEYFNGEIVQAHGLMDIAAISAGDGFTVALGSDGSLWAWGYRASVTTSPPTLVPLPIGAPGGARAISAGAFDGFGNRFLALAGDGAALNVTLGFAGATATPAPGIGEVMAVANGHGYSLALRSDGTVWRWSHINPVPVMISGLDDVIAIAAGGDHSLALRIDGTVWSWGGNAYGQRGDGAAADNRMVPGQISGLGEVTAIAAGYWHSLAVTSDNRAWSWGRNHSGQLGDGSTVNRNTPGPIEGLINITAIAGGPGQSIAIKQNGTIYNWGMISAYDIAHYPMEIHACGP